LKDSSFQHGVVLDILRVDSGEKHQLDLPLHFQGQVTNISHEIEANVVSLEPLGSGNGYQHLWKRAVANVDEGELFQLTFLNGNRFYTHSALATAPMEFLFTETGANDPEFNLRHEQALIQRASNAGDQVFVSVLEPHGEYNGGREFTTESSSSVAGINRASAGDLELIQITRKGGAVATVALSFNPDPTSQHRLELAEKTYEWTGFFQLFED